MKRRCPDCGRLVGIVRIEGKKTYAKHRSKVGSRNKKTGDRHPVCKMTGNVFIPELVKTVVTPSAAAVIEKPATEVSSEAMTTEPAEIPEEIQPVADELPAAEEPEITVSAEPESFTEEGEKTGFVEETDDPAHPEGEETEKIDN